MPDPVNDAAFLTSQITPNIGEMANGYLVCYNVPLARTGVQLYLGKEIGGKHRPPPQDADKLFKVYRLPEDVFHPDAIKSFEGQTFTDDHPLEGEVTPDNYGQYIRGHIHNVHPDEKAGILLGDIVNYDPNTKSAIKSGAKREISSGYFCDWIPYKDGYKQTNIRANHVSLVNAGRAGKEICIKDSKTYIEEDLKPKQKRSPLFMKKDKILAAGLQTLAKDSSLEAFSEALYEAFNTQSTTSTTTTVVADTQPARFTKKEQSFFEKLFSMAKDKRAKDEDVREEEEAHEEEEIEEEEKDEKKDKKELKRLKEDKKAMDARLGKLESTMDALIKALDKKAKDSDEEDDEKWLKKDEDEDETMDEASEEKREKEEKEAKDAALKLIKTLKPAIINLPVADQAAPKAMLRNLLNFVKGGVAKDSTTYSDVIGAISSNGRNQNKKPVGDSAPAEAFSEKLENVRKTRNATELAKAKLAGK